MSMQYATAQGLTIPTYSSDDSKTPTTPTNPVVTISKDGAALAAAAGTVTVIADYGVHVAFTTLDMTAAAIAVKVTSDNCDPVALSLVTEAGYTADRATNIDNLDVAVSSIDPAGNGVHTVTVTVATAAGAVFEGVRVSMDSQTETLATPLVQYTDTAGQAEFHAAPGAWRVLAAANGSQAGGYTDVTVDGIEAVTVTVVAANIPAPSDPDNYLIFNYELQFDQGDLPFGASEMVVTVVNVSQSAQVDTTANAHRGLVGEPHPTDATGLWSFEVAKAVDGATLTLKFAWTDASDVPQEEFWQGTIDATQANPEGQIAWADCRPYKSR